MKFPIWRTTYTVFTKKWIANRIVCFWFSCAWHTEISASIIISFFTDVSGQTRLWTSYFFLDNKNETGFQQDIKMMFKIRFFLLTFSIHFVSSFLYHNKVIDRSKLFILFQCLLSFFSVLFFLENVKYCSLCSRCKHNWS